MNRELIKNVAHIEVNGFTLEAHIIVYAMYDVVYKDENGEYAEIESEVIDEFEITRSQILKDGGYAQLEKEIAECYNAEVN